MSILHKTTKALLAGVAAFMLLIGVVFGAQVAPAHAAEEAYIGEVMMVPYNFCPQGWVEANGQTLPIMQNSALFSLLGTTYGGNGTTTFMVPDLRGRVPVGFGQAPGLSSFTLGQTGGQETFTLKVAAAPVSKSATPTDPSTVAAVTASSAVTVSTMQPYQTLRYCIASTGIYPSRPY